MHLIEGGGIEAGPPLNPVDEDYVRHRLKGAEGAREFAKFAGGVEWLQWLEGIEGFQGFMQVDPVSKSRGVRWFVASRLRPSRFTSRMPS